MSYNRHALITAYCMHNNCTHAEADRAVRGIELAYAEKQNAELLQALDEADGRQVQAESETRARLKRALWAYRRCFQRSQGRRWTADRASERLASMMEVNQELLAVSLGGQIDNQRLQSMIERFPEVHMRFGVIDSEGNTEMQECADWCYACKIETANQDAEELRTLVRELKQISTAWQRRGPHSASTLATMYRLLHGHDLPKAENTLIAYTVGSFWYCLSCGKDIVDRDEVSKDHLMSCYDYRCDQCGTVIQGGN